MLNRACLCHSAVFLPLVLVPVAPIIVGQTASIPTLEGLQFEVLKIDKLKTENLDEEMSAYHTHLMSLHLV